MRRYHDVARRDNGILGQDGRRTCSFSYPLSGWSREIRAHVLKITYDGTHFLHSHTLANGAPPVPWWVWERLERLAEWGGLGKAQDRNLQYTYYYLYILRTCTLAFRVFLVSW